VTEVDNLVDLPRLRFPAVFAMVVSVFFPCTFGMEIATIRTVENGTYQIPTRHITKGRIVEVAPLPSIASAPL